MRDGVRGIGRKIGTTIAVAAGVAALATLPGACDAADDPAVEDPTDDPASNAVVTYTPHRNADGTISMMTALLQGTLTLHDGCVVVENDHVFTFAAFPDGTTSDGEKLQVGEQVFHIGDTVTLGGGGMLVAEADDQTVESLHIPAACAVGEDIFVAGSIQAG